MNNLIKFNPVIKNLPGVTARTHFNTWRYYRDNFLQDHKQVQRCSNLLYNTVHAFMATRGRQHSAASFHFSSTWVLPSANSDLHCGWQGGALDCIHSDLLQCQGAENVDLMWPFPPTGISVYVYIRVCNWMNIPLANCIQPIRLCASFSSPKGCFYHEGSNCEARPYQPVLSAVANKLQAHSICKNSKKGLK